MIQIENMRACPGRVAATFSATANGLELQGCALIKRDDGYTLSIPRIGSPSRSAPLNAAELAAIQNAAVDALQAA